MATIAPGNHYLIPADVAGGETAEVFEVFRIVTQPAIPEPAAPYWPGEQPALRSEAWTTVRLRGVNTGRDISLGLPDLLQLGEPVTTRKEG